MSKIYFYEKTGCINNTKQKEILKLSGYDFTAIDIIKNEWTRNDLLKFFVDLPVEDWFNRKSPRVKSNEIIPENYGVEEALKLLLEDHLLIKRPLLEIEGIFLVGFNINLIEEILGSNEKENTEKYENLINQDLNTCPQEKNNLPNCD